MRQLIHDYYRQADRYWRLADGDVYRLLVHWRNLGLEEASERKLFSTQVVVPRGPCRLPGGRRLGRLANSPGLHSRMHAGGGYEIRTREGVNPTRFPSERHRPLGESSAEEHTKSHGVRAN